MQEEIEAHKKEWELGHLKSLKEEEEKAAAASDSDPEDLITIPREEACQVNNRSHKARSKSKNASDSGSLSSKKPTSGISTRRSKIKLEDSSSNLSQEPSESSVKPLRPAQDADTISSDPITTPNSKRNRGRPKKLPKGGKLTKPPAPTPHSSRSNSNTNQSSSQSKRLASNSSEGITLRTRRCSAGVTTRYSSQGFISPLSTATDTPSKYFTRRSNER